MLKEKTIIEFEKYQGAGNDFIIIDGREHPIENPLNLSKTVCKRRFSIGADDLLYLEHSNDADVKMRICEPDGGEASMCGNGIRCVAAYIRRKEGKDSVKIETLSGPKTVDYKDGNYIVNMGNMQKIGAFLSPPSGKIKEEMSFFNEHYYVVSPGEPHAVTLVNNLGEVNIDKALAIARNFNVFPYGINVDYVELEENSIRVRTFERGVWAETFACGTGAVSSAFISRNFLNRDEIIVRMKGGNLKVVFKNKEIFLSGKAEFVFSGKIFL
jgi:diaminopimelate epimerase